MVSHLQRGFSVLLIFFLCACAQMVPPTGGAKDVSPPKLLIATPKNQSIHFSSDNIRLEFDEFLALKQLKENLVVSPPLKYGVDAKMRAKKLELFIRDTLKANTTYVLNFGNAITDLAENNPLKNFQYVFSTGELLDTLTLTGKVLDAFSLAVEEEMLVLLHPNTAPDSAFQTQIPNYVSRTDQEGNFLLTNLKEGAYRLYALKETNNNYQFDKGNEKIAFLDTSIYLGENNPHIHLKAFEELTDKQFIESKKTKAAFLFLDFKQALSGFEYEVLNATIQPLIVDVKSDTVEIWWPEQNKQEIELITRTANYTDTIEVTLDSFPKKEVLTLNTSFNEVQNYFEPLSLSFNRPLNQINPDYIQVQSNTGRTLPFSIVKDSTKLSTAKLSFIFQEDSIYTLQLFPGSFVDIYNHTVDTSSHQIRFNTPEDFGELSLILENTDTTTKIVQLINESGAVLRSVTTSNNTAFFPHLMPFTYRVKLIEDLNLNGQWDTGDYADKKQAEKTFLFNEQIEIRSNWEKEVRWVVQ